MQEKIRRQKIVLILLILILFLIPSCQNLITGVESESVNRVVVTPSSVSSAVSRHMFFGNISGAGEDTPDNFLVIRDQYALAYSDGRKTPLWVSWELSREWIGEVPRGKFRPDTTLPLNFLRVDPKDYTRSGYDRGHLCPAKDRSATLEDSEAVFLMTNIFPQAPDNNQGPWEKLESYSRKLVYSGETLHIAAGISGVKETISGMKITVPEKVWKIAVVVSEPGVTRESLGSDAEIIAVIMPNENGIKEDKWQKYLVTPGEIEDLTGYSFFSGVPENVRQELLKKRYGKSKRRI